MTHIERYRLIEQTATRGVIAVWRAADTFDGDVEVALELIPLTAGNEPAIAELRSAAHERARREKNATVRIFEDLERGIVGVATRRAPRPETRLDAQPHAFTPPSVSPTSPTAPAPLVPSAAPPATLRDGSPSKRSRIPPIVIAIAPLVSLAALLLWLAPWRSAETDPEDEPLLGRTPNATSKPTSTARPASEPPSVPTGPNDDSNPAPSNPPTMAEFDAATRNAAVIYADEHACTPALVRGWLRVKCQRHTPQGVRVSSSSNTTYPDGWTILVVQIADREQRFDFTFSGMDRPLRTLRVFASSASGPVGEFDGGSCNPPPASRGFGCCVDTDGSKRIFKGACADRNRRSAP